MQAIITLQPSEIESLVRKHILEESKSVSVIRGMKFVTAEDSTGNGEYFFKELVIEVDI